MVDSHFCRCCHRYNGAHVPIFMGDNTIFFSDFIGGGLAGIVAAKFGIINNAPGTAAPIPGLLAPFGFIHP